MILYHGSNVRIDEIDLGKSRPNKDFGKGFYLSDNEEQAREMAEFKISLFGGSPVVNRFEFDWSNVKNGNLDVKIFDDYSEEWARFVLKNRTSEDMNIERFDFVYGPIANDRVGIQIKKLQDGNIDMNEFLNRLKYMKGITFQYFFGSEKAIKLLRKL